MKDVPHCLIWLHRKCACFYLLLEETGHDKKDTMKDYCSTLEESFTAFNRSIMKQGRFFHILRNLNYSDNKNEPNMRLKL
jgi:hypothetical protein